uniref:Uncharacterized protein LOC111105486 n=1 Tax=Crassostrea virginica TaxID=6565 RepID=A0A8B8AWM7_CRAVI|nr:uncharacterized protein LOC111105486 [Crassostrea virginica]
MCFKNSLWTLILFLVDVRLSISLCQGIYRFKPCCTGERWDSDKKECVPCPSDHYGKNCTFTCNVPYDGYRCVMGSCTCNKLACNVEISSPECFSSPESESLSKFSTSNTEVETTVRATEKSTSINSLSSGEQHYLDPTNNSLGLSRVILVGLGACGVLLCCFVVMEYIIFTQKKRNAKTNQGIH